MSNNNEIEIDKESILGELKLKLQKRLIILKQRIDDHHHAHGNHDPKESLLKWMLEFKEIERLLEDVERL